MISGYLITSLIAKDVFAGRFSFISFYERRIRRIFPALFGLLFFCIFAAAVLFAPRDFVSFGKSATAIAFFASNIFFQHHTGAAGYFDPAASSQALLHTWSLSVEEQFYLFFPTSLLLLARWAKDRITQFLLVLAVISFAFSVWATWHHPLFAFYSIVPRAWELLIGALLALKAVPPLEHRVLREIAGGIGLGLIAVAVVALGKNTPFPGFAALLPCVGAWLVIYSGENGSSWTASMLSFSPLVFVGVISYSLYLWHWPLIVFARYFVAGPLNAFETAAVIAASCILAFLSFEFVEAPFRGRESHISRKQIFSLGAIASVLAASLGITIYAGHGLPLRYDEPTRQLIASNLEREDDFLEVCGNWRTNVRSLSDIRFCNLDSDSPKKIMFWGDSHVQQLYPLIQKLYGQGQLRDHGVVMAIANGCAPAEHLNDMGGMDHCDAFAHFAFMRADESDIDTVFIGFNTWWTVHEFVCPSIDGKCTRHISPAEARRLFLQELAEHIQKLRTEGKRVIVCLPFPMYDKSIPQLEIRNAVFGRFGLAGVATDFTLPEVRDQIAMVAKAGGADMFDPRASLCSRQGCVTQINGVSIYKDDNHIAASQIGILEENFRQLFQ